MRIIQIGTPECVSQIILLRSELRSEFVQASEQVRECFKSDLDSNTTQIIIQIGTSEHVSRIASKLVLRIL